MRAVLVKGLRFCLACFCYATYCLSTVICKLEIMASWPEWIQTDIISLNLRETPQMSFLRMQPGIFMLLLITGLLPAVHAVALWIKQLIRQSRQLSCSLFYCATLVLHQASVICLYLPYKQPRETRALLSCFICVSLTLLKPCWCGISCDNTGGKHPQLHCNPLSTHCHWSLHLFIFIFYRIFFKETPFSQNEQLSWNRSF